MEFTLSSPCSRFDPLFSRQGAALAHLDSLPSHDLVLRTDGSVPFNFGKSGYGILANCSLCGTEATLFFSAGSVCSVRRLGATLSLAYRGSLDPDHILHELLAGSPDGYRERLKPRRSFVPAARRLLQDLTELDIRAAQ